MSFFFFFLNFIYFIKSIFCRFQVLTVIGSLSVLYNSSGLSTEEVKDEESVSVVHYWGMGENGFIEEALRPPPSSQGQRSTSALCVSVLC